MRLGMLFITVSIIVISLAVAELPSSFYEAMATMKNQEVLCVKNYDAGASLSEAYTDFEYLNKDTEVKSKSTDYTGSAALQASMKSEVIGSAQIVWQSLVPYVDDKGRHTLLSRNEENLTGVFSIERFIELSTNNTFGLLGPEWLPCG